MVFMFNPITAVVRLVIFAIFVLAAALALFIAWWFALNGVAAIGLYLILQRLLRPRRSSSERPVDIEGEYVLQKEEPPDSDAEDGGSQRK